MDRLSNGFYEYTIAGGSVLFLRIFIAKSPKEQTILCDVKMNSTSTVLFVNIVAILAKCTTETIDNIPVILKDDSDCQYMTPHYRIRLPKEAAELKKIMIDKGLEKIVDLSDASTVDRNTLSKVLSGDMKPSTTVIEKLMYALDIPPERAGVIFFKPNLRKS